VFPRLIADWVQPRLNLQSVYFCRMILTAAIAPLAGTTPRAQPCAHQFFFCRKHFPLVPRISSQDPDLSRMARVSPATGLTFSQVREGGSPP
jgi:hypothetical protein